MADGLTFATWLWLLGPLLLVVAAALVSWLRHRLRGSRR